MGAVAESVSAWPSAPRAEIVAVGSELLTPTRSDTNSLFITAVLNELGIEVAAKGIVGDRLDDVMSVVRLALERVDLLVMTGGLGPTDDDLTRDAVSRVIDKPLIEDQAIADRIRARFKRRGLEMPDINRRQAMVPEGATPLENSNGTAPGLWIPHGSKVILLLPGPPREMQAILRAVADGPLAARVGRQRLFRRVLSITGRTGSHADAALHPLYEEWRTWPEPVEATILAVYGQLELHLSVRASSDEAGRAILDRAATQVRAVLGLDVFSERGETLEQVVGALLLRAGWHIAAAESCTGGLLTSRLTDVPGSSTYVERTIVAYSNEAKIDLLGVPAALIEAHGAVSEPVAQAMAEGARSRAGVELGVGITGIAGPGGGTEAKPVGTVAIALATPDGEPRVRTFRFAGDRLQIKFQATQFALDWIRRLLLQQSQ
jgi:competence/damage-inducible protein CinA-like protein